MTENRLASGAWLTPQIVTFSAVLMIVGTIASLGFLFVTAHGTLDVLNRPLGTDFSSLWTAGRMALDHHAAESYDWPAHAAFQRQTFGTDDFFPWSYPPVFLLVVSVLAMLPYLPALLIWQAATLAAAAAALWAIIPSRRALLIGFGFPGVLICLGHGQTGFLTAALLTGGLLLLRRHEIGAGILFGLAAYKPQLGLLLPIVLIAGGYWRAIGAAVMTIAAMLATTLAIWGWPVWQAFLDSIPLTRRIVFEMGDTGFEKFQSAFACVRLWDGPAMPAYGFQALFTAGTLVVCVWIWRSKASFRLQAAALLTGTLLSTPYVLDYDLIAFGLALAFYAAHALERGFLPWDRTVLALAWFAPAIGREVTKLTDVPIGLLALTAVFLLIVRRVRIEHAADTVPQIGYRPHAQATVAAN